MEREAAKIAKRARSFADEQPLEPASGSLMTAGYTWDAEAGSFQGVDDGIDYVAYDLPEPLPHRR